MIRPAGATGTGALEDALDELARALGRSVSLDAPDGRLLGYSTQGADVDPVRITSILARHVPDEIAAYQRQLGIDRALAPTRLPGNADLRMSSRLCVPVLRGRTHLALLWVLDESAPLDAAEIEVAARAARRIRGLLEADRAPGDTRAVDGHFTALLAGSPAPGDPLRRLRELVAVSSRTDFRIFVAIPVIATASGRRPDPGAGLPADGPRLAGALHGSGSVAAVAVDPDRVVGLVADGGGDAGSSRARIAAAIASGRADGRDCVIGFSPAFRIAESALAAAHATATATAECAAFDRALPPALSWADLGIYRRLITASSPESWSRSAVPIAGDSPGAAMLRQTLETYLDLAGDAARTTATLTIHRTTLYYRLDRIATTQHIDLSDGLARTGVHVALKMRRLAQVRDHFAWTEVFVRSLVHADAG